MISTRVSNPPLVKPRDGCRMRSCSHETIWKRPSLKAARMLGIRPKSNSVPGQSQAKWESAARGDRPCLRPRTNSRNLQLTAIQPAAKSSRMSAKGRRRGTPKRCSIAFEPRISPEKRKRMKYLSEVNSHPRHGAKELVG